MMRFVKFFLLAFLTILGLSAGLILFGKVSPLRDKPDVILVLGGKTDGERPTPELQARLDRALELMEEAPQAICIVTGGVSLPFTDQDLQAQAEGKLPQGTRYDSERGIEYASAPVMADYLISRNISPNRILMEDKSTSTWENMVYSRALLEDRGLTTNRLCIVTSRYHVFRSQMLAHRAGLQPLMAWPPGALFNKREVPALIKSFLIDR